MQSKFTKTNPQFFFLDGRAPGAPVLDPPLIMSIFANKFLSPRPSKLQCRSYLSSLSKRLKDLDEN